DQRADTHRAGTHAGHGQATLDRLQVLGRRADVDRGVARGAQFDDELPRGGFDVDRVVAGGSVQGGGGAAGCVGDLVGVADATAAIQVEGGEPVVGDGRRGGRSGATQAVEMEHFGRGGDAGGRNLVREGASKQVP